MDQATDSIAPHLDHLTSTTKIVTDTNAIALQMKELDKKIGTLAAQLIEQAVVVLQMKELDKKIDALAAQVVEQEPAGIDISKIQKESTTDLVWNLVTESPEPPHVHEWIKAASGDYRCKECNKYRTSDAPQQDDTNENNNNGEPIPRLPKLPEE